MKYMAHDASRLPPTSNGTPITGAWCDPDLVQVQYAGRGLLRQLKVLVGPPPRERGQAPRDAGPSQAAIDLVQRLEKIKDPHLRKKLSSVAPDLPVLHRISAPKIDNDFNGPDLVRRQRVSSTICPSARAGPNRPRGSLARSA
jgi:hypothetical protein